MSILVDAFKLKPAQAISFFKKKGMKLSWNWFDTWKEAHTRAFTVAKCMKADVLQDIRSMVQKALDEGIPFEQFKRDLAPRLQEKGWWGRKEIVNKETGEITEIQEGSVHRLRTIYQTNLQTSYMAGRYRAQQESSMPFLQYISVIDGKTTDRCRSLHLRVFRKDDPIWNTIYPPNHWGCRSRVRTLSKAKAEREKIPIESSENKMVTKEVVIGGKKVNVTGYKLPSGNTFWPDPGWDYNPGKQEFKPDLNRYDSDIKEQLKKDLGFESMQSLLARYPVKKSSDIQIVIQQFHTENPEYMKNGFRELKFTNSTRYLMATDCNGTILVSGSTGSGFNSKNLLTSAMKKMSENSELTFDEEYSIEALWHEILHNRAAGRSRYVPHSIQHVMMETLNQFVARHTYPEFIAKLGGSAVHQTRILEEGIGYGSWVKNFRTLINDLGIKEQSIVEDLKTISFNSKWSMIHHDIAELLAEKSKTDKITVMTCMEVLRRCGTKGFKEIIRRVL